PVSLCILPDPNIEIATPATERILATIDEHSAIVPLTSNLFWVDDEGKVCAEVSEAGTYFAAAVVPNYAKQTNRVSVVQYRIGAVIYLLCLVYGIVQIVLLALDYENQKI